MKVPFFESKTYITSELDNYTEIFRDVMTGSNFIMGGKLTTFERNFANYCGVKNAFGVGNGLDALTLCLRAANIKAGDHVVVPGHTFVATALAVLQIGAVPVLVDVDEYFHLDPKHLEKLNDPKIKAIMPVHLYGMPADMKTINEIAAKKSWVVIEDNAQAQGAKFCGKITGALGDMAGISFYPTKNLGAFGDGGAVTTNSDVYADAISLLRNYGQREKYNHVAIGLNSRLDELQAAFLDYKLKSLNKWNSRRAEIAAFYSKELEGVGDLVLPKVRAESTHVYHLYVVRTAQRDLLAEFMKENGVHCLVHYPKAVHQHQATREKYILGSSLSESEAICRSVLSLPIYPEISLEQLQMVVEKMKLFFRKI